VYQLYQLHTGQDINFISSYVYYDIFICVMYRHSSGHVTIDCVLIKCYSSWRWPQRWL